MPFGVWDESDWRPVNYGLPGSLPQEASIPSECLLQAKAEARRSRTCVAAVTSSSSLGFTGKALRTGGPSLASTHFTSRWHGSCTSIGELQDSVDTTQGVQGLSSQFTSCCDSDDEDETLIKFSEVVLQKWKREGDPGHLPAKKNFLYDPRSGDNAPLFVPGYSMTRSMTTASMVLENLQKELGSLEVAGADPGDEDAKLTIGEAVQLIANGTVIGTVAEDMLKKLKTGGVRSGIPRRYVVTYELYGLLTNKVRDVLDQMDEISQTEVQQADLAVKMQAAGNIDASSIARAVGRENDEDFITKLKAVDTVDTGQPDETEMDQQEQIVGEMDKLLTREELKNLLTDVIAGLDRFRWQDLANDLKKWCTTGETSDNVVRRLLEDTVELQREAVSVLALSKILAEETLSSRILLAARALADFNDAVDREMGLMLERFGIDPALISRTYTHSASLLDAFASKKSLSSLDREEETESVLADSQPFATTANLSDMEKAMVKQRDHQRRVHKKVKGDLTALMQEHRRKVELNRSLYDHLMMTTMRDERRRKGGQEVGSGDNYLQSAMQRQPTHESQELEVDELETLPDIPPEEDAAENVEAKPAAPGRLQKGAHGGAPTGAASAAGARASHGGFSVVKGKGIEKAPPAKSQAPKKSEHFQIGAFRLLHSAKAFMDELVSAAAERDVLEENIQRLLRKMELQTRTLKAGGDPAKSRPAHHQYHKLEPFIPEGSERPEQAEGRVKKQAKSAEVEWLQVRRELLWKDLNERAVPVSLKDIIDKKERRRNLHAKAKARMRVRLEEEAKLPQDGTQSHDVPAAEDVREKADEPSEDAGTTSSTFVRQRRRAVVMEAKSSDPTPAEEGEVQVPRSVLQDLAQQRDNKITRLSDILSEQEKISTQVLSAYGDRCWDFRLEAQRCAFLSSPWSFIIDRVQEEVGLFQVAVPRLKRLSLEARLEELGEDVGHFREMLHHLQQSEAMKPGSGATADDPSHRAQQQLSLLLQRLQKWNEEVKSIDLEQLFEVSAIDIRIEKTKTESAQATKKVEECQQQLLEAKDENQGLREEKVEVQTLLATSKELARAVSIKKKAVQEVRKLSKLSAEETQQLVDEELASVELSTSRTEKGDLADDGEVAARDLPARGRRGRRLSTSKTTTSQAESAEARSGTDADLSEEVQGNGSPTRPTGSRRTGPSKARAAKAVKAAPAQAAQVALAQADAGQAQAAQGRATAAADGKDGKVRGERAGAANFETEPAERAVTSAPSAQERSDSAAAGRARSKMKVSGDDPSDKKLKAANLENRSVARKLNQRQQELEKLAKQALGRKATVPRKQDTDTEAGWEKKIHGMQVSIRNGAKMADFWEERLGVWHEEVEARCGEEVLLELQRLSELKPPERDLMPLQMALLRRARTDMQNVDRVQQAGTDLKQRFATAVEHGDVNLKDLQKEVSNMMKRLSADLSLGPPGLALTATAVSAGTAATRSPAGVGEGAADATTARRSVHKSMKSRKTAVEAAREALRQRMAGAHAARGQSRGPQASFFASSQGVKTMPLTDVKDLGSRRSLHAMRQQLGVRRTLVADEGLMCRSTAASASGEASPTSEPPSKHLEIGRSQRKTLLPQAALGHKARMTLRSSRLDAASTEETGDSKRRSLKEELREPSLDSLSDRQSLSDSEDGVGPGARPDRRWSGASSNPEETNVWIEKTPSHQALLLLRSCRAKLIQRFGGIDRAYIRSVPALTGMTAEVFRQLVSMMNFSDEDAQSMFSLLLRSRPTKEPRNQGGARTLRRSEKAKEETPHFERPEFNEALRRIISIRTLQQLRARLRLRYGTCEASAAAAFGKRHVLDRVSFRDFLLENGVSGREARNLFFKMARNNEVSSSTQDGQEPDNQGRIDQVTRPAFFKSLVLAEGLQAAEVFREELMEMLGHDANGAALPGLPALPVHGVRFERVRREAAALTEDLLTNLFQGVDRAVAEAHAPHAAYAQAKASHVNEGLPDNRAFNFQLPNLPQAEPYSKPGGTSRHVDATALGGVTSNRRNSFVARVAPAAVATARATDSKSSSGHRRGSLALSGLPGLNADLGRSRNEPSEAASQGTSSSGSASETELAPRRPSQLLPPGNQRTTSKASQASQASSRSRRSSLATSESSREEVKRFSLLEKRLHVETEMQFNAALLKVFDNMVLGPDINPWEPMSRNHFMYVMKPMKKLSEENLKALFLLDGHRQSEGKAIPQELALRALAGFGHGCRELKVHLGYKVEEESKLPKVKAAAKPKASAEATGLVVAGPSNLQALTEDGKELPSLAIGTRLAGKELFAKAVRKVGLTTKLMPKKEAVALPALTVVGKEGTEEREASPLQWRPGRKASSVLRQSSSLGELDGKLSGKVAWTSYASRDEADMKKTPTLHAPELSEPDLIELQSLAKRESSKLAQRLSLFDADKQQNVLIWSQLRSAFATLLKKGSALRAFQQLGGDTLERDPLRDALVRTLSLPTIDAERIADAVLTIESDDALGRDDFVRVLKFLQPVRSVLDFRTRLVQRFGTAEAGLDAFVECLGKGSLSKEKLETVALGLGMGRQDIEAVFKQASVLGGGGGVTSVEILRVSLRHAHILQQLHLLEQYLGGPSSCQAWLNDRQNALAAEVFDLLQPLGVSSNFCQQLVAMLRDRALNSVKAGESAADLIEVMQCLAETETEAALEGTGREELDQAGLEAAKELRRYINQNFDDFRQAYQIFDTRLSDGIDLLEWEDRRQDFGFADAERWALVYGKMVGWHHPRWDNKQSEATKVTLEAFTSLLTDAAPVNNLYSLRARCQKAFGSLSRAWSAIAEDQEEVTLSKWQHNLIRLNIGRNDSLQLFWLLCAGSCRAELSSRGFAALGRGAFLSATRSNAVDASNTILELLTGMSGTPVSAMFEIPYPRRLLSQEDFTSAVIPILLKCRELSDIHYTEDSVKQEARLFFNYLDADSEGFVSIDDLLDEMTAIQAVYLPLEESANRMGASQSSPPLQAVP